MTEPRIQAIGPRVYVRLPWIHTRLRIHHGLTGLVFMAVGAVLAWHDRLDRWWFHDE